MTPNKVVRPLKRVKKLIWQVDTEPIKDFSVFFDFKQNHLIILGVKTSDSHTYSFQGPLNWYKFTMIWWDQQ